ncbi:MAG: multifunctional oxoglutarate decarboxylase/oxoglutarate dehydrogenase thiamine pyrophosphate-binding subunit/dihydrolipoyllysine-residue succinyltransferase subunit [Actinobacteria bacterium]|nr:MAG: multifunctional oxoglutarate decarboxylase/oxoglutarate dehydrogenase thiamine pyrophosphate-binding subunit/dihydrolipoyllysine-residue succinyltransferase subunit [Actinomycetota bacterium]
MSVRDVDGLNVGYAQALLEQYLENPEAVPEEWRSLFESGDSATVEALPGLARLMESLKENGARVQAAVTEAPPPEPEPEQVEPPTVAPETPAPAPAPAEAAADGLLVGGVAAAMALIKAIRTHGHLAANLDPLGSEPVGDPALEGELLEPPLTPELQALIPASVLRVGVEGETLAEVLPKLREIYCGTIAYEIEHISDHQERVWLRHAIESGRYRRPLSADERRQLLERLTEIEGFEHYLKRQFLGQKQFSIEGLDVMVPMLDEAVELGVEAGAHEVVIGMAHRGRLNVLAHIIGRPYEELLREFEGERTIEAIAASAEGASGDVKYHLGAVGRRSTKAGDATVLLAANPSHLEAVDPVVEGVTRAEQTDRSSRSGVHDPAVALPILIHGDASFPAQGVVAETLNLQRLLGYTTGGTLHLIANNQIGFTTDPADGRSTRYSSDLAKGFDTPIIHVNADDPEAALSAVRLALAFRRRFESDVVVDLVGYRRHGHNEGDEPSFTQPLMAERIANHQSVRALYAERLAEAGEVSAEDAERLVKETQERMRAAHEALKTELTRAQQSSGENTPVAAEASVETSVPAERLRELQGELVHVPEGFTINPKLVKMLERRVEALDTGGIDWGQAESLAFASLLVEGIPIRLTGQDTERGTFSHRHLVLHDAHTGAQHAPIKDLADASASIEAYNSPLSEYAALGFEYGYSVTAPEALVLWEAQFGDFVNGAQIVIDQFLVSGLAKWRQTSRLTLLLPHAYEGNGPEHSSARLERFLQLAAQENIRVVNATTAGQYFHLLRRQALDPNARPLIVMTPKGLLRLKEAASGLDDLAHGRFRPVLDDPAVTDRAAVTRLILTSGKLYYDIVGHELRPQAQSIAVARLEQLYPFPVEDAAELVRSYQSLREVVWAQEEPQNMGAWRAIRHRLEDAVVGLPLRYVGRPWRASPSEGYPTSHLRVQDRIVRDVLEGPA